MENPIEMDDLGVPLFLETPICFYIRSPKTLPALSETVLSFVFVMFTAPQAALREHFLSVALL